MRVVVLRIVRDKLSGSEITSHFERGMMFDVYLYGMISPSTVYVLAKGFQFPAANAYGEIATTLASIGGEAANSAIVLSKFGLSTRLDGNWIHPDRAEQVLGMLRALGVNVERLTIEANGGTHELVISDEQTRTVFGNYAAFHSGPKQWNAPRAEDVVNSRIVCLDPYFKQESVALAELCVNHERPYVTLDCRFQDYVAQNAAAIVVSHELRDQAYPGTDYQELFAHYLTHCRGLVIFTFGSDELWYARQGGERRSFAPFAITPLDTAGAGDSFRGAVAYGLLQGWSDNAVVEFASAVAACVCLTTPHTLNAPNLDGVMEFLQTQLAQRAV